MKNVLFALLLLTVLACSKTRSLEATVTGKNGTSCSVAPEVDQENQPIGAKISCTDGSFALVLNGATGAQGVQGPQGNQGVQGPVGQQGASCQAYRSILFSGVWLACPGQFPALISDGRDGRDGESCTSLRQSSQNRVRITCGNAVTYVYDGDDGQDGEDGKDGKSCTVLSAPGGANVKCGNGSPVFIANGAPGPQGTVGPQGEPGRDGLNGEDGEDAVQSGVHCNVHNLDSWSNSTHLPEVLKSNPIIGSFVLPNFSVPDSQSSLGFPGMPASLQNQVGLEGYALDCSGYLNVPTSGEYTFKFLSDDGAELRINGETIVGNQGLHSPTSVTKKADLDKGPNHINVVYYQGPATQIALELKWSGPNTTEQVILSTSFTH